MRVIGIRYRELARELGISATTLSSFGIGPKATAEEARRRIIAAVGLPAWSAAQAANPGPGRGSALLRAKRAAGSRTADDDVDEPCASCDHDRAEHEDGEGACTIDGCDCDAFSDEADSRKASAAPSNKPGAARPMRSTASPEQLSRTAAALQSMSDRHCVPVRPSAAAGVNVSTSSSVRRMHSTASAEQLERTRRALFGPKGAA